jgi:hypothetical protein
MKQLTVAMDDFEKNAVRSFFTQAYALFQVDVSLHAYHCLASANTRGLNRDKYFQPTQIIYIYQSMYTLHIHRNFQALVDVCHDHKLSLHTTQHPAGCRCDRLGLLAGRIGKCIQSKKTSREEARRARRQASLPATALVFPTTAAGGYQRPHMTDLVLSPLCRL